MAQFKAFDPNVEVNGQTVLTILNAVNDGFKANIVWIMKQHSLSDIEPKKWYSQQDWLDSLQDISDKIGYHTLFSIGKGIPENSIFPKEINNLKTALAGIDIAYHMNHRGGEIGFYKLTVFDSVHHSAEMECKNPYPCHFDRGIISAIARKFKPETSLGISVELDKSRPERSEGADSSYYLIRW